MIVELVALATLTCPTCQGRTGHDDGTCGTPDPGAGP